MIPSPTIALRLCRFSPVSRFRSIFASFRRRHPNKFIPAISIGLATSSSRQALDKRYVVALEENLLPSC